MKAAEFIMEDPKLQKVAPGYRKSNVQLICDRIGLRKPHNVFVKVDKNGKADYQLSAFIRAGEKLIHVHNYETNQDEAHPIDVICIKDGFKFLPINTVQSEK